MRFTKAWFGMVLVSMLVVFPPVFARGGVVHVSGYTKENGTYVAPHHRTSPDNSFSNNWSSLGNINPYTGELGTKVAPSSSYYGYKSKEAYSSTPSTPILSAIPSLPLPEPSSLPPSETFQRPTWCVKAKTTNQKMVCQDKNLSASAIILDDRWSSYKSSHTSSEIEKINDHLISWEKNLFRKCNSVSCLESAYDGALNHVFKVDYSPLIIDTCSLIPNIKQKMEYSEARDIILKAGWQMTPLTAYGYSETDDKVISECFGSVRFCNKYQEIISCSGQGYCKLNFFDCQGRSLNVFTYGDLENGAYINSWEVTREEETTKRADDLKAELQHARATNAALLDALKSAKTARSVPPLDQIGLGL